MKYLILTSIVISTVIVLTKKVERTGKMRRLIIVAINRYNTDQIMKNSLNRINYDVMESFDKTLFRLSDWGYANIVPLEILKKILPYIESEETK